VCSSAYAPNDTPESLRRDIEKALGRSQHLDLQGPRIVQTLEFPA
jgi:hypothetical protein